MEEVSYQPFDPAFLDDPYPQYAALRAAKPVEEHEFGFYALWRHADVTGVLKSGLSVDDANIDQASPMREAYEAIYSEYGMERRGGGLSMLDRDPPDHTRLRRLVSQAFTPKRVENLMPAIESLVDDALDQMADEGTVNLIDALAFPLPFAVITEMLGMPETDVNRLRELSSVLVRSLEPVPDEATIRAILESEIEMQQRTSAAIAWKREHPADDLLTAMINAKDGEDVLTDDELVAQVVLLYVAGHETTVNLIGNGAFALINNPEQARLLADRPDLDENAVEEFLRFDSPVQMTRRVTTEDIEIAGQPIEKGRFVIASLGSANRDEEVFGPDADQLRVDRPNAKQHASFGGGVHHCLGNALARREGRVALARLVRRFETIELAGPIERNLRINLRGITHLPVTVR
jgi:cytochrome P450